jgi:ribosomal protein S18 acetylase RimI-like enzyme
VLAADGGRLKLEWAVLRNRPAAEVRDLLWWRDGRLLGFLGIYGLGRRTLELTGMVDPDARRRGIGTALFDAALPICRRRHSGRMLLVVPRESPAGRRFATRRGLTYEHSEHVLTLRERPVVTSGDPALSLRQAAADDIPALSRLYLDGFGDGHIDPKRALSDARSRTLIVERGSEVVGTVRVAKDGGQGSVYAFVISSEWRARGVGREVLGRVCRDLFDAGAGHVNLEVEVANERALGLYTSIGFSQVATDDYYELAA